MFRYLDKKSKQIIAGQQNIKLIENPVAQDLLSRLRDKNTSYSDFRIYLEKISLIIAMECAYELSLKSSHVITPLGKTGAGFIDNDIVLVPVLRAGLGMLGSFTDIFPDARVSHIGIYRNETTLKPVRYYFRFPSDAKPERTIAFILDPMLATGGSIIHTITTLKKLKIEKIVIASILCAPEGLAELYKKHNIKVYTCSIDKQLNKQGYIVPGLGDAGDRIFGT